jgi:capsular polysaccharide transport system permease protein
MEQTASTSRSWPASVTSILRYFGVLRALLRLEEDNRRQAPMDSIINLLEPILLIATLTFLFYFLDRRQVAPLGGLPVLFYATGFFPLYFFIYLSRRMRGPVDAPHGRFPVEQRLDHIIVHILLRMVDYTILAILLFGGIYLFFTPQAMPADLGKVAGACLAVVAFGFGLGTVNLVVSRIFRPWTYIFSIFSRALIMFSGVFYVPDFLQPASRDVLSYNPLMHAVALFKLGFYPQYPAILLSVPYLSVCAVIAVLVGLMAERASRRLEGR